MDELFEVPGVGKVKRLTEAWRKKIELAKAIEAYEALEKEYPCLKGLFGAARGEYLSVKAYLSSDRQDEHPRPR